MTSDRLTTRRTAFAITGVAGATILGALASQHVYGLVPCKLCLWQRWPYYVGVPLAVAIAALPSIALRHVGLAALCLVFLASTGLGAYHAGAEWGFWPGPSDCGGGMAGPASAGDLLKSLENVTIVSCTEAAWRFLGISLAGWNALVSLAVAVAAAVGVASRS